MTHSSQQLWYFRELGNVLHIAGRLDEAAMAYSSALLLAPDSAECCYNLAVTRMRQNRLADAASGFEKALRLKPDYAEAHLNLGILQQAYGRPAAAIQCYRQALRTRPRYESARYNLALTLQDQGRLEEALEQYRSLHCADAHNNAGNTLLALGRAQEALASYRRALAADPNHSEARWNLGVVQLLLGDFEKGWEGFEWRFRQRESRPRHFDVPLWDGSPLAGRTILIHAEQGLGDTLQFVRFLPELDKRGGFAWLECQPALSCLIGRSYRIAPVPLPSFDCHAPLLSLPYLLESGIPAGAPYLSPAPELIQQWRERLGAWNETRVGLAWAGNPAHKNDRNRSLALEKLAPLAGAPDTVFFSLQKGPQSEEALNPPAGLKLIDLQNDLPDFHHTAAAIMNLDLVISVDSAVAHLAGALGRPVWTLLPFAPDWRWMLDRTDSPWYPTMRLFRQKQRGDWDSVVREVCRELSRK